jgi:hypothetical protein
MHGKTTIKEKCISFFVCYTVDLKMALRGRKSFPYFSYYRSNTINVSSPIACVCGNYFEEVRGLTVPTAQHSW